MHVLKIKILDKCPNKDAVINFYQSKIDNPSYEGDCGVDLMFPEDIYLHINRVTKCGMGVACEFIPNDTSKSGAFDLVSRSSISNTPLILTNSIGIIDAGYRGEIIAAFRCLVDINHLSTTNNENPGYKINRGEKLIQIVAPDRNPIKIQLVEEISTTDRGSNGFGSTNAPRQ